VAQVSSPALAGLTETQKICLYVGFDPTARSLHLGHLLPVMQMAWFQRHGHRVIALVGGATGMVGDPSGRSTERNLLTREQIEENSACVQAQLRRFLDFEGANAARMADNYEWIGRMTFIEWLRDVGKYFNVHQLMSKESVRKRMETEQGISFTEFSYQTKQAYDFSAFVRHRGLPSASGRQRPVGQYHRRYRSGA
jgi:tyrosyl-tRNA synthetase